jgi:2-polyprenyl-3-methyl-5-hydroxy-6-metoxy-1,4-benzoquinol methylase
MPQAEYLLGHSEREIQRLIHQAAILRPITERLFREIALRPGMRVLDLGCGAGDVSMLAAELVGPTGLVIGAIDAPFLSLGVCGKLRKDARPGGPVAKT